MFTLHDVPDPGFTDSELEDALRSVKRRVHRRRGGAVLPVLIAVTVGAGVYMTVDQPISGDRVAVGLPGTEAAAGTIDTASDPSEQRGIDADAINDPAAEATSATTDLSPAAASEARGEQPGAAAGLSEDASEIAQATAEAIPPGAASAFPSTSNRPNPPAISFDTSNVITRNSDASASAPTPPVSDADTGIAVGETSGIGRSGGSDDAVGESSPADGLEGPHTASPGSSSVSNPSADLDDSGDGANLPAAELPAISFEDTGEPPTALSATNSSEVAAGNDPAASAPSLSSATSSDTPMPYVAKAAHEIEGRSISVTLTVVDAEGTPFPCGVFVDFGGGAVQTTPCTADCEVPQADSAAERIGFEHTYAEAGGAQITIGSADPTCVADPSIQLVLPVR